MSGDEYGSVGVDADPIGGGGDRAEGAPDAESVTGEADEHRGVEERLRESERFHRLLLSRISDAVFLTDESGDWTFVCANVEEIFGRDEAQVLAMDNIGALLGGDFLRHLEGEFEERQNIEWTVRDADGDEHVLLVNVKRVRELGGGTRLITARDVTERHAADRARRESERRFRELFDGSLDGAYVSTEEGRLLEANPALADMLGYESPEAMMKVPVRRLYLDPARRDELMARLAETGEVREFPLRLNHATEDRALKCEVTAFSHGRRDGGMQIMGIVRDVTERRAREARLLKLSRAVEQAHEGVVITGVEGRIEYVNPAFEAGFGYPPNSIVGQNIRMLSGDLLDEDFQEEVWETLGRGDTWKGTFLNQHADGSARHHETVISPIRSDDGEVVNYVALYRDVTRERQLEKALNRARRMETVGRLSGGIAHHFNNLLTAINGYAELLLAQADEGSPEREDLSRIKEAATEAAALTRQLVAFNREVEADLEELDLARVVSGTVERIGDGFAEDVRLELVVESEGATVSGDEDSLEQTVLNLLWNAADALPDGGRVEVRVERADLPEEGDCLCGGAPSGRFVRLVVADDGIGMDEETLAHAFEPFFTTKDGGGVGARGAGLGLASCYAIVENHDGHVCAWSRPGEGSRFEVLIPTMEGRPGAQKA